MADTTIFNVNGKKGGKVTLPEPFLVDFRPDLIRRAVLAEQSRKRQPQGRSPTAGRLVAAASVGPGRHLAKVPRTSGSHTQHGNKGAFVNSTVGGHLAHPPRVEKRIVEKINKKEHRKALFSAVAATGMKDVVEQRGHRVEDMDSFPVVITENLSKVRKTTELIQVLTNLGLDDELQRTNERYIRSGKGKMRGRRYRTKTGPLLVFAEECDGMKACKNIPGVEATTVNKLSVEQLAPGTHAGRMTIWTESAIEKLKEW